MPFDAARFPEEDGSRSAEPTPVARWLHYCIAALVILVGLVLPLWVVVWIVWRVVHDLWLL
jgi:hypothetical protein